MGYLTVKVSGGGGGGGGEGGGGDVDVVRSVVAPTVVCPAAWTLTAVWTGCPELSTSSRDPSQ